MSSRAAAAMSHARRRMWICRLTLDLIHLTETSGRKRSSFAAGLEAFHRNLLLVCIALTSLAAVPSFNEARAQMGTDAYAWKYFLDEPPIAADFSQLPVTARDVIVAKVRIIRGPYYLVGRDQSGKPPPPPKNLFQARVEIVEVLHGQTPKGAQYWAFFGAPGLGRRDKYPHTPSQKTHEYFVISYTGEGDELLAGFPTDEREYDAWRKEVSEYERQRGRPGAHDR